MKTTKQKNTISGAELILASKATLVIPPTVIARVNQMALRKGKAAADLYRTSTTAAIQALADDGASLDEISAALAGIEAEVAGGAQ